MVNFSEVGHVLKVSLPTDFSCACITGLASGTTPQAVGGILAGLGFNILIDCIRVHEQTALSETKAIVKVEDPYFAKDLSAKLKEQGLALSASILHIDSRRTNCRKVYISWHKGARSVSLNFGNGEIAERVSKRFNEGRYKCLGQSVKSSDAKRSSSRGGRGGHSQNPLAWTITLTGVAGNASSQHVQEAITSPHDKPRHIEMGSVSYQASNAEVSVEVRSLLEEHGRLESFYLAPTPKGKRDKATAWFQDEAEARSACSLNGRPLDILRKGRLTVTLVQSVKVKIPTTVYLALKSRIDSASKTWRGQHQTFRLYPDASQRFKTLKVEGNDAKNMALASKTLDEIASGVALKDGEAAIWSSALSTNGSTYRELKSIEKELDIVIIRDKSKRQLLFYGPPEKHQQAVRQIAEMLEANPSTSYEIELKPSHFSWMIQGGFRSIEQALGMNVAVFNVVLKTVTVNGTKQQYDTAISIMEGTRAIETQSLPEQPSMLEGDCPICFCQAETPIQTSRKHTYCLSCFEECCKSAASTSKDEFQIKCPGDSGTCSAVFNLRELKEHLSSAVFETVLQSSFKEYIQRHPETFHYCPTPDCGYVYRCTAASDPKPRAYTCPKCFEPICTSCHARHGEYTCAEYKDIVSGGVEALAKLKKQLNIKDCPRCTTPMEKTEGCNHMTCGGCKAHICWVCMAVFDVSGPCYAHMTKEHGGIGLGLEYFMD
jgi:IBR domain, a half RING-finger domain